MPNIPNWGTLVNMKLRDYIAKHHYSERQFVDELNERLGQFGLRHSKHAYRKWKSGERMPGHEEALCITEVTQGLVQHQDMRAANVAFQLAHGMIDAEHAKLLLQRPKRRSKRRKRR